MRQKIRLRTSRAKKPDDESKRLFGFQLRAVLVQEGITAVAGPLLEEHGFCKGLRKQTFRWDFCFPDLLLAIEINGGIWTRGAHGHPADILRNMEKACFAATLGWRVLQFSTDQVEPGLALAFTLATIERLSKPCLRPLSPDVSSTQYSTPLPPLRLPARRRRWSRSPVSS